MRKDYLWLFATAVLWSLAGIVIKNAHADGVVISAFSCLIAFPASLLLYHKGIRWNKTIITVAIARYLMSLSFIYANILTTVANALILQYTSTIFILIYQSIDHKKLPEIRQCLIIGWVIMGLILFFVDDIDGGRTLGNVLALFSGSMFGLEFYVNTKKEADAFSSAMIAYILSFVFGILILHRLPSLSLSSWLSIAIYGIVVIALPGITFALGIATANALTANLICMLEIIMSPLWAFIMFGETISGLSLIGAVMIVGAVLTNIFLEAQSPLT
ncbi:MAG: DMT family transporter [Erysipelotrichaceae bacterium]|nr:DMT family transporter [Erysipelotrichaceae bacterium]